MIASCVLVNCSVFVVMYVVLMRHYLVFVAMSMVLSHRCTCQAPALPLSVQLVDGSVELFPVLFASQAEKNRSQLVEYFIGQLAKVCVCGFCISFVCQCLCVFECCLYLCVCILVSVYESWVSGLGTVSVT